MDNVIVDLCDILCTKRGAYCNENIYIRDNHYSQVFILLLHTWEYNHPIIFYNNDDDTKYTL